ncbi:MAG: response regulator [Caulobacteraceae bacterium]
MDRCEPSPLLGRRILVVEDEYFLAQEMSASLRALGAEVVGPLPSHREALAQLNAGVRVDAAVLDVNLGVGSVFPLAQALREKHVPFVLSTGYGQGALEAYGSVARWQKPFDSDALARAIPAIIMAR